MRAKSPPVTAGGGLSRSSTRASRDSRWSHSRPPSTTPSMVAIGHAIEADTTAVDEKHLDQSADGHHQHHFKLASDRFEIAEPTAESDDEPDVLPNGGYGWVIVVSLLLLNACTWGINTTYGVFSSYFLQHNYYNAKQLDYAWVGGLSAAFAVSQGPLSNFLVRRFGIHLPMLIGAVAVGLGQICSGLTKSFGVFLVCQGLVFGLGMGLILVPSQPLLAHWFDRRLSLAQGIAQAGSGVGALFFSNITPLLLDKVGVKKTYLINGCISLGVLIPSVILMKGRHKAVGANSAPLQLSFFWHPGYRYYLIWAFLAMMGYFIAIYTLASYCTNGLGFTQAQGGAIQSILAAGQIIGRPIMGELLDRGGRTNMVMVSYIICGIVTLTMWMLGRSFAVMAVYGLICGATSGTIHSACTPLSASIVGVQELGSALSIYWMTLTIPNLMGQAFAIMLVDYSRSHLNRTGPDAYSISIGFCGGLFLASAVALIGCKHYLQGNWKVFKKS